MRTTHFIWLTFILSLLSSAAQTGSIEQIEYTARQAGMAGAFLAHVEDSSAMALNPAGMAPSSSTYMRFSEFSINASQRTHRFSDANDEADQIYAFLWSVQNRDSAIGLGIYDSAIQEVTIVDPDTSEPIDLVLNGYDIAFNYASRPAAHLKLGITGKITSFGLADDDDGRLEEADAKLNIRLGAQYQLLESDLDFQESSTLFGLGLGAIYQPEVRIKAFENIEGHLMQGRKVTAIPQTIGLGSHIHLGWLSEFKNIVWNLNADIEQQQYSGMADLILGAGIPTNITLKRALFGTEILLQGEDTNSTFAIRAGMSRQSSKDFDDALNANSVSFGMGYTKGGFSIDLAHQKTLPNEASDADQNRSMLSLSFSY